MTVHVRTSSHRYELHTWQELPQKQREWFDYIDEDQEFDARFFRYNGSWYDAFEFEPLYQHRSPTDDPFRGWDALSPQMFGAGVVIRFLGTDLPHDRIEDDGFLRVGWFWITDDDHLTRLTGDLR